MISIKNIKLRLHLKKHGWSEERQVDCQHYIDVLSNSGFVINEPSRRVLASFGGLTIEPCASDLGLFDPEVLRFDPLALRWMARPKQLEAQIGSSLSPLGMYGEFFLYICESWNFYSAWDALSMHVGKGVEESLENMIFATREFNQIARSLN